ncbi:hypothetical protein GJ700_03455 [Duganella sp. FT92W]|uniref:Uncharacterized protein n=1 Tax=Pseudoduganella rivuli TaxID=2666085 RepID=A0A7X2IIR6_9BURK|nr:hypothetical protein [Pseudoduganella rivuli]MRV70774.1 hypothetical protein [Pseudoduganella rivuli]
MQKQKADLIWESRRAIARRYIMSTDRKKRIRQPAGGQYPRYAWFILLFGGWEAASVALAAVMVNND